jgi:hypothetical protein
MATHAWYSAVADRKFGHIIYKDKNGLELKCTEVRSIPEPYSLWNDAVYLGEVEIFVRSTKNWNEDISMTDLLTLIQDGLSEQVKCKSQIEKTGKCFCFTCPIKRHAN